MLHPARTTALALAAVTAIGVTAAAAATGGESRPPDRKPGAVVRTDTGAVRGTDHGDYRTFQGIPYAAPPTGDLRWQPPQRAARWDGVRDATKAGSRCTQTPLTGPGPLEGSEDCLFVDVTTPNRKPADGNGDEKPVLVWLHGGGFTNGSGSDYDAHRLATRGDAVVVTVNYRLGIFGFFEHPALKDGDAGLLDQQAALRWVRRNARAFGGDAGNVTLLGESAGGMSTCSQLTSPAAGGLFHRAVIESGSCRIEVPENGIAPGVPAYRPWQPAAQIRTSGAAAAAELGCPDAATALACLRGKTVQDLTRNGLMQRFSFPTYGNRTLPLDPAEALRQGRFHRMPVLQGTNRDENRLYVSAALAAGLKVDAATYDAFLADAFGADAPKIAAAYPLADYPTPALAWATVLTDAGWTCPTLAASRDLARRVPTYGYEFADGNAPNFQQIPTVADFPFGAAHGTELTYLFDFPGTTLAGGQRRLSERMIDYWTAFAHRGDPNHRHAPVWPRLRATHPEVQSLAPGAVRPVDLGSARNCALWDEVNA